MADEAVMRASLQITKGEVKYRSYPDNFTADVSGEKGPVVGAVTVPQGGVSIDLSELTYPGFCRIRNQGSYTIIVGILDGVVFHPIEDILTGEHYIHRLSEFIGSELDTGTGTATTGSGNSLYLRAIGGESQALLEVFEK